MTGAEEHKNKTVKIRNEQRERSSIALADVRHKILKTEPSNSTRDVMIHSPRWLLTDVLGQKQEKSCVQPQPRTRTHVCGASQMQFFPPNRFTYVKLKLKLSHCRPGQALGVPGG
jgi:hypothetical protein